MNATISLVELRSFDPGAREKMGSTRFCCPLCHGDRVKDSSHRSLAVSLESGVWFCHRCKARGVLSEFVRGTGGALTYRNQRVRSKFALPAPGKPAKDLHFEGANYDFSDEVGRLVSLPGTRAGFYLQARGLPVELADRMGVKFSPSFLGVKSVVFPMFDYNQSLAGAHGRACEIQSNWRRTIRAPGTSRGVFGTGCASETWLVIVEAPIDALSLELADLSAIATIGTSCPEWLSDRLAFKPVLLGHDRDEAGEEAAVSIARVLKGMGAEPLRLRPPAGCKDWNAALTSLGKASFRGMIDSIRCNLVQRVEGVVKADTAYSPLSAVYGAMSLYQKYRACSTMNVPAAESDQNVLRELLRLEAKVSQEGENPLSDFLFANAGEYERLRKKIEAAAMAVSA
jgi:hypothetical protein